MSISGLILGLISIIGFIISNCHFHLYDWLNWINIPLSLVGFTLCIFGFIKKIDHTVGIAGAIICIIALILSYAEIM